MVHAQHAAAHQQERLGHLTSSARMPKGSSICIGTHMARQQQQQQQQRQGTTLSASMAVDMLRTIATA
jgi:hypothetical protein